MTGWDLDRAIEGSVGEFWNVTRSQVYRELRHLAEAGLVEVAASGARAKVTHRITGAGRQAFLDWLATEQPPESRRLPILLTTFFGDHLPAGRLAELLQRHRTANREVMERYRVLERRPPATRRTRSPPCASASPTPRWWSAGSRRWACPWPAVRRPATRVRTDQGRHQSMGDRPRLDEGGVGPAERSGAEEPAAGGQGRRVR